VCTVSAVCTVCYVLLIYTVCTFCTVCTLHCTLHCTRWVCRPSSDCTALPAESKFDDLTSKIPKVRVVHSQVCRYTFTLLLL
jgi:hypothetical protein